MWKERILVSVCYVSLVEVHSLNSVLWICYTGEITLSVKVKVIMFFLFKKHVFIAFVKDVRLMILTLSSQVIWEKVRKVRCCWNGFAWPLTAWQTILEMDAVIFHCVAANILLLKCIGETIATINIITAVSYSWRGKGASQFRPIISMVCQNWPTYWRFLLSQAQCCAWSLLGSVFPCVWLRLDGNCEYLLK